MSILGLAWKQISRNLSRTLLMAVGVGAGAATITAATLLVAGATASLRQTVHRLGADLMIVPKGEDVALRFNEAILSGKPAMFYFEPGQLDGIERVEGVERATAQTYVETLDNARCCAGKFFLVGYDPETDFIVRPWLDHSAGAEQRTARDAMIAGDRILLRLGRSATFYGKPFTVAGVLAPTGTGMDSTIFVPQETLREMIEGSASEAERALSIRRGAVSAVFVKARPRTDIIDLAERIERDFPGAQAILSSTVGGVAAGRMAGMTIALSAAVAMVWAMSVAMTGIVFSQAVRQQRAELGLLAARGAPRGFIVRLVAGQSAVLAIAASALGCALGAGAVACFRHPLSEMLETPDVLPPLLPAAALAAGVTALVACGCVVSSLVLAWPTLRQDPFESIKQGAAT